MWTYSVIRMHARIWYSWWQRTCDVRYIPPSIVNIPIDIEIGLNRPSSNVPRSIAVGPQRIEIPSCSLTVFEASAKSEAENKNIPMKKQEETNLSETTQTDEGCDGSEYVLVTQELDSNERC